MSDYRNNFSIEVERDLRDDQTSICLRGPGATKVSARTNRMRIITRNGNILEHSFDNREKIFFNTLTKPEEMIEIIFSFSFDPNEGTKAAMLSDLVRLLKEETVDRVFINVFETSNGYDIDLQRSLGSSLGSKTDHNFLEASAEDFSTVDELALFLETAIKESFPNARIFNHGSGLNDCALELRVVDLKKP